MMTLFDEQEIYETHFKSVGREFEEKGHNEGRTEVIMSAYKNGNSAEQIAMFIELPLAEVQNIIDSGKWCSFFRMHKHLFFYRALQNA